MPVRKKYSYTVITLRYASADARDWQKLGTYGLSVVFVRKDTMCRITTEEVDEWRMVPIQVQSITAFRE